MEQAPTQIAARPVDTKIETGNVIVTGGLGFIGSHFIRQVLAKNQESYSCNSLINVDYCGYGSNQNNLKEIQGNAKYRHVYTDINSSEILKPIFQNERIDLLVNFAAETHVDRSISNPEEFLHSNVNGVLTLLELCREYDVKKFVQISTDEVYGDASGQGHISEEYPLQPNSPYSAAKASADMLVRAYNKTYGINTSITRCSNNYGPNQFPEKLIPKTIIRALKGLAIPIYGDGLQSREWIYVQDHVRGILKVISDGKAGEIYNISSSEEISNIDLVNQIITVLDGKGVGMGAKIEHVPDRPGHDRRYSLDSSKIKNQLGWEPIFSFDQALRETVSWYLDNGWWWEPLVSEAVLNPQPWKLSWNRGNSDK